MDDFENTLMNLEDNILHDREENFQEKNYSHHIAFHNRVFSLS